MTEICVECGAPLNPHAKYTGTIRCRSCAHGVWRDERRRCAEYDPRGRSGRFNDFRAIEREDGLLDQPDRFTAHPPWGYGWPTDETLVQLLPRLRGLKPRYNDGEYSMTPAAVAKRKERERKRRLTTA